jgi:hypothetical protein
MQLKSEAHFSDLDMIPETMALVECDFVEDRLPSAEKLAMGALAAFRKQGSGGDTRDLVSVLRKVAVIQSAMGD